MSKSLNLIGCQGDIRVNFSKNIQKSLGIKAKLGIHAYCQTTLRGAPRAAV